MIRYTSVKWRSQGIILHLRWKFDNTNTLLRISYRYPYALLKSSVHFWKSCTRISSTKCMRKKVPLSICGVKILIRPWLTFVVWIYTHRHQYSAFFFAKSSMICRVKVINDQLITIVNLISRALGSDSIGLAMVLSPPFYFLWSLFYEIGFRCTFRLDLAPKPVSSGHKSHHNPYHYLPILLEYRAHAYACILVNFGATFASLTWKRLGGDLEFLSCSFCRSAGFHTKVRDRGTRCFGRLQFLTLCRRTNHIIYL